MTKAIAVFLAAVVLLSNAHDHNAVVASLSCGPDLETAGTGSFLDVDALIAGNSLVGIAYGNGSVFAIPSDTRTAFQVYEIVPSVSSRCLPGPYLNHSEGAFVNPTALVYCPDLHALLVLSSIQSGSPAPIQLLYLSTGSYVNYASYSDLLRNGIGLTYDPQIQNTFVLVSFLV